MRRFGPARERLAEGRKALIEASPAALESLRACLRPGFVSLEQCRDAVADGGSSLAPEPKCCGADGTRLLSRLLEHAAEYQRQLMGLRARLGPDIPAPERLRVGRRGRLLMQG